MRPVDRVAPSMPLLIRLIAVNWAIGALIGTALAAALVSADVAHLRSLMFEDRDGATVACFFFASLAMLSGSVVAAAAVMLAGGAED